MTRDEIRCLFRYCQSTGAHIDIGTNCGGSAHTAAIAKKGHGHVYSIDPSGDQLNVARENLDRYLPGWEESITLVEELSQTWDSPVEPETVLIDGDHTFKGALGDWMRYSPITKKYILFHDNDLKPVQEAMTAAHMDKNWIAYETVDKITVFKRLDNAWEASKELEDVRRASQEGDVERESRTYHEL